MTRTSDGRSPWRNGTAVALAALMAVAASCGGLDPDDEQLSEAEALLLEGRGHLTEQDHKRAFNTFEKLDSHAGYACDATYGKLLARIHKLVDEVNSILTTAALLSGNGAPGFTTAQDYTGQIKNIVAPFEELFGQIRVLAVEVVEEDCTFDFPEGYPIEVGREGSTLHARAVLGYQWDAPVARALVATMDGLLATLNFVLAHRFEIEGSLEDQATVVGAAYTAFEDSDASADTTHYTWVTPMRAAGIFADWNPRLLTFSEKTRMTKVDNNLLELFRMLYHSTDEGETGLLPGLIDRGEEDSDLTDNVLSWYDNNDDGTPGTGDTIHFGLVEFEAADSIALPDLRGGIDFTLSDNFGDITEAIRLAHEIIQNLGDQMAAVETTGETPPRLGLGRFNQINEVLTLPVTPPMLPEALEFDLRAFFVDPVPLRDLVPYWYNGGIDESLFETTTPFDVFMVEAESAVTSTAEPFVYGDDVTHFPDTFMFDTLGVAGEEKTDQSIAADQLSAADREMVSPNPYINWQSPSFHGLLWVNPAQLATEPESPDRFEEADSYLVNKALNDYIFWAVDEDLVDLP